MMIGTRINRTPRQMSAGVAHAFDIPGGVPEYVRPRFCEGHGPPRRAALEMFAGDVPVDSRGSRGARVPQERS